MKSSTYNLKFRLIGDSGVGKTSLLFRYAEDQFFATNIFYTSGIDFRVKTLNIKGKEVKTTVWDTAGQHALPNISNSTNYYRAADAVIVVFDLTDMVSFNNVEYWLDQFTQLEGKGASIILVGNKSDMNNEGVVEREAVKKFIERSKHSIEDYIETSAKTGENVLLAFETAAEKVLERLIPSKGNESSQTPRDLLIQRLESYISRIENHKNPYLLDKPNFSYGFYFFKKSRALNREANYYLAKELLQDLKMSNKSIQTIFDKIDQKRNTIIGTYQLFLQADFKDRGVKSQELNTIINNAKRDIYSEKQFLLK